MRTLVLSPDWDTMLFWWDEQGQGAADESTLPISNALRCDLDDCYKWFSEMFLAEDAKPTLMDQRLFDARAFGLWERLRMELRFECHVLFYSQEFACKFEGPMDFKAAQRAASSES
jgi:hypothetical protein